MLPLNFYNFFAGAGLASTGLTPEWECIWANDIDPKKAAAYGYDIDNIVSDMFGVTIEYDLVVPTLSALGGNPATRISCAHFDYFKDPAVQNHIASLI